MPLERLRDESLAVAPLADVGGDERELEPLAGERAGELLAFGGSPLGSDDGRPFRRKPHGYRPADPAAGSGYDRDLPLESECRPGHL